MHFILEVVWASRLFATNFLVLVMSCLVGVVCLYDYLLLLWMFGRYLLSFFCVIILSFPHHIPN